jgi:2-polyprenyl-6-methoxyphenol hydroxylase-like FAD-dependent oxidoreductase
VNRILHPTIPAEGRHAILALTLAPLTSYLLLTSFLAQCINSIDRALLNESLLTTAADTPNVRVAFEHKIQSIDFDRRILTVRDITASRDVDVVFDLCVGADGSYSVVRRQLMRVVRFVLTLQLM